MTLTGLSQFTGGDLADSMSAEGDATIVNLRGDADPATLQVLVDVLARVIAEHDGAVVIDPAQTEFIDTATVRAIRRAERYPATAAGG
jgi:anti-anti-sigma regulatory factor